MTEDNKWTLPEDNIVDPPLFTGEQERDFQKQISDEVIERIVNQFVMYYAIDYNSTNYHDIYGEAIRKTFYPPVKVMAIVEWMGEETTTDVFNIDKRPKIQVYFPHRRVTEDRGLEVREGDFVKYGRDFYEIVKLNEDKELFGTFKYKVEIIAECVKARQDYFRVQDIEE